MVHLLELDSKKYGAILRFKKQMPAMPAQLSNDSIPDFQYTGNREIDEFGEIAVNKLKVSQKRLTSAEIDCMIIDRKSGKTFEKLAEKYGCHWTTIRRILRKNGMT